jgi:hypothetical protein
MFPRPLPGPLRECRVDQVRADGAELGSSTSHPVVGTGLSEVARLSPRCSPTESRGGGNIPQPEEFCDSRETLATVLSDGSADGNAALRAASFEAIRELRRRKRTLRPPPAHAA